MSAPLYTTVIQTFLSQVLQPMIDSYVYHGYQTLADHLKLPLGMAVVLSLCLLGVSISQGWVKLSIDNFVKCATKVGLIYAFAMHWGIFSHYIVFGIQVAAGQIGAWLLSATPMSLPQFAGSGIDGAMQAVLIEVTNLGGWVWQSGGMTHPSPWLVALLIWGFGYTMLLIGLFEIVLSQLMLAILFTLAPLFISFTLFKPTQPFFDRWLGLIAGFCFLLIFISTTLALALNFDQWALSYLYDAHGIGVTLTTFVPMMIVSSMGIGMIIKVAQMAQSIGGAVCTSSGHALLAGIVGGAVGGTMAGAKGVASTVKGTIRADRFIQRTFMGKD